MIRVLIVEDQRMAREDMENYIQSSGRYCLAASITNAAMAETVCRQSRCELVLMDVCTENDESGLVAAENTSKVASNFFRSDSFTVLSPGRRSWFPMPALPGPLPASVGRAGLGANRRGWAYSPGRGSPDRGGRWLSRHGLSRCAQSLPDLFCRQIGRASCRERV